MHFRKMSSFISFFFFLILLFCLDLVLNTLHNLCDRGQTVGQGLISGAG